MYLVTFVNDAAGNLFEILVATDPAGNDVVTVKPVILLNK